MTAGQPNGGPRADGPAVGGNPGGEPSHGNSFDRGGRPGRHVPPVEVRRSAWRMWGLAVMAIPMLVAGLDLLTRRRLTNFLRELLFRPEDTQLPEPRDTVWAVALVVVGLGLAIWGMRELLSPTKVITADRAGIRLRVRGPFRAPWFVGWGEVEDLGSGTVGDEGIQLPVLWLRFTSPASIPDEPWGARRLDDHTLALLASDWDVRHVDVATELGALAAAALEEAEAGAPEVGDVEDPESL